MNGNLDRQIKYAAVTGNCPVCRKRKSAHGITCGRWGCINLWLPGGDKSLKPGVPVPEGFSTKTAAMFKSGKRINDMPGYKDK
jgi:hypothetical protein